MTPEWVHCLLTDLQGERPKGVRLLALLLMVLVVSIELTEGHLS